MFEGTPLPLATLDVLIVSIWMGVVGAVATVVLRSRFEREWALTLWSGYQITRVWQRLADESARTGGTFTSHIMGIVAWAMLGSFWGLTQAEVLDIQQVWISTGWAALLGLGALLLRHLAGAVGAFITLEREAVERGFEVDRHLRNWWLWLLMALLIWEMTRNTGFEQRESIWQHTVLLWWGWLIVKWLRQLQSIGHKRLHFGWGFAYLCTFEFGPAVWLFTRWG